MPLAPLPLERPCPRCGAKPGDSCGPEDYYAFMVHGERYPPRRDDA